MDPRSFDYCRVVCIAALSAALSCTSGAATLCVAHGTHPPCFWPIQAAVNAASPNDVILVAPGTYKELAPPSAHPRMTWTET